MYKIEKIKHKNLTQGLLRFCANVADFYFDKCNDKHVCEILLEEIHSIAKETTFLQRNKWEPLIRQYEIQKTEDRLSFVSVIGRKLYLEFKIVEV